MRASKLPIRQKDVNDAKCRLGTEEQQSTDTLLVEYYLTNTEDGRTWGRDVVDRFVEEFTVERIFRDSSITDGQTREIGKVSYVARAQAMKGQLREECQTQSEFLIVDEVVASWCRLQLAFAKEAVSNTLDAREFWSRQVDRAQKNYLRAVETLSRVRRYEVVLTERSSIDGAVEKSVSVK